MTTTDRTVAQRGLQKAAEFEEKFRNSGGLIGNLSRGAGAVAGTVKDLTLTGYDKLDSDNMKLARVAGGGFLGLWCLMQSVRCFQEGRRALNNSGNIQGSIAWSWAQSLLFLTGGLACGAGLVGKGPVKNLIKNVPLLAVAPAATAYGMELIFSLTRADNPIMKLTQFGMTNYLKEMKIDQGEAFDSRLHRWWLQTIRPIDEKICGALGMPLDRGGLLARERPLAAAA